MTEALPPGWAWVKIAAIADTQLGKTLSTKKSGEGRSMPYLRNKNVQWHRLELDDVRETCFTPAEEAKFKLQRGDLLVCEGGEVGRCAVWQQHTEQIYFQNALHRIRPHSGISTRWLEYILRWYAESDRLSAYASGVTISHLVQRALRQLEIPVAPSLEQRRVVAAIEEHFSRLDAAGEALAAARARIEASRRAILSHAFTGRLVPQEPDDEPASALLDRISRSRHSPGRRPSHDTVPALTDTAGSLPPGWTWATVADVSDVQLGRQRSPQHHTGEQMRPYLRSANVTWQGICLDDVKEMNFDDVDFEQFRLAPGDILLNEASGSPNEVGKPAIWNNQIDGCCFQNTLLRLRPRLLDRYYVYWYCYASALTGRFGEAGRGVNIRHLGKRGLAQFPIPIAPLSEQERIVAAIEEHFSRLDAAGKALAAAQTRIEASRRAILSHAFTGHLVPQDPDDEPASTLLNRIAASPPTKPDHQKISG